MVNVFLMLGFVSETQQGFLDQGADTTDVAAFFIDVLWNKSKFTGSLADNSQNLELSKEEKKKKFQ